MKHSPDAIADELFALLWEEIDFDDHPIHAGHSPSPVGDLEVEYEPGLVKITDERIRFELYTDAEKLVAEWGEGRVADVDETGRPISIHLLSERPTLVRPRPGRLGVHRWSLHRDWVGGEVWAWVKQRAGTTDRFEELPDFSALAEVCVFPERSIHSTHCYERSVGAWRNSLREIRNKIRNEIWWYSVDSTDRNRLEGWTWHLEIDNKADRLGWYIRCPAEWDSLFTIFAGYWWNPVFPEVCEALLLFERAPPGELDRADESDSNVRDALRTFELCHPDGALTALAEDPEWAEKGVPYELPEYSGIELWPPSMNRWPLLYARSRWGNLARPTTSSFIAGSSKMPPGFPLRHPGIQAVPGWISDRIEMLWGSIEQITPL